MSRGAEYQFIETGTSKIVSQLIAMYEKITESTVRPASPEMLFIRWVSDIVIQERVLNNYTGNQNIPSRAEGKNLDALGELFLEQIRPAAKAAVCTERFSISQAQPFPILVPAGTRVTDVSGTLIWEVTADARIPAGETSTQALVRCQTPGTIGNGYAVGQIGTLIDLYDYCTECGNITESEGGADEATDEEYYRLMRASMDGYSTAGSMGGYIYHAMRVSTEIADVVPNSPSPGVVYIYVLMNGGKPAGEEMKHKVLEACSGKKVRAFTDDVHMGDPVIVPYDIDLTYYIHENSMTGSAEIRRAVEAAVTEYIAWQSARLGRDINPSRLYHLLMQTGIKRVDLRSPVFTPLRDGKLALGVGAYSLEETMPQVAQVGSITLLDGGYEDE